MEEELINEAREKAYDNDHRSGVFPIVDLPDVEELIRKAYKEGYKLREADELLKHFRTFKYPK